MGGDAAVGAGDERVSVENQLVIGTGGVAIDDGDLRAVGHSADHGAAQRGFPQVKGRRAEIEDQVDVFCNDWPEPKGRQLRGSSRAVVGFVTHLDAGAIEAPDGKAIAVRIGGTRIAKIGKGTSADVSFAVAPRDKWPERTIFDEADDDLDPAPESAPAPMAPSMKPGAFDGLEDAAWS